VHIGYHVEYDDHFYSAPYQLVGEEVWIRASGLTIEIFHKHTTADGHRTVLHQKHAE
jgi:hypothetical protein